MTDAKGEDETPTTTTTDTRAITAVQRRMRGVWSRRECSKKLAAWRGIQHLIVHKQWDRLEPALHELRALGFSEAQLAVVLADYKRMQDLSNAQGYLALALAATEGGFKDFFMALNSALDQASAIARKHGVDEGPLRRMLTGAQEYVEATTAFLQQLDEQQHKAIEVPPPPPAHQ